MTDSQKAALLKWVALIGFILGAIPSFIYSIKPPTLGVVPIAPGVMSILAVIATKWFLGFGLPIPAWKKMGMGVLLCDAFVVLWTTFLGIVIGNEWWAWAFVFLVLGLICGTLCGILLGIVSGNYFERVLRGDTPPPTVGRKWAYTAILALAVFIGIPILSWWNFHG